MKNKFAIILPLKENFSNINFGAVSVWIDEYLRHTKIKDTIIFCRKLPESQKYLSKKIIPVDVPDKYFTNLNYIKKINAMLIKHKITRVEIHNRPEYARFLILNNPNIKINFIFHNDPNSIRYSKTISDKEFLLDKCNKVIFVSGWVKKRFFINLSVDYNNNTEVIYNFVSLIKRFPIKKKLIIFSGKLNKSKGYEIFGNSIIPILNKYRDWRAIVCGSEEREKFIFKHKRLDILNWVEHKKMLSFYSQSSISVVNPTWDEPFGRTALESASRGCAVITSQSGGLNETFVNNLILKKNNKKNLIKLISDLIDNKKYLLKIQKNNFNNIIHTPVKSIRKLDNDKNEFKINNNKTIKSYKIFHIGSFGEKNDHRLFNLSISHKLTNGLVRNGHDVINFDYRNFTNKFTNVKTIDEKIIDIIENYRPDLVLLGHNNNLFRETLQIIKKKYQCKIVLWYEDHLIKGDPNYLRNLNLIEKNNDLIDQYFVTTSPDIIKTKIKDDKLNFLPIPVDPNIENGHFYETKKTSDLFFALSHGVNYGKLKNKLDDRAAFISKLLDNSNNELKFNIIGLYNEQPKWNYRFDAQLMLSKTALNLSRGGPNKYSSSNRIASIMGNGLLPFIHEDVMYQDFFDNDEIITYKNSIDLLEKLILIKDDKKNLIKRSKNAKKRYFDIFSNKIVADFIIHKTFGIKKNHKYLWGN